MGIDFDQFDRYINGTDQYGPDTNGDGEPDGDGIFDQLLLVTRNGQGVACFGTDNFVCGQPGASDGFALEAGGPQFLGTKRVVSNVRYGSGSVSNGFTLERAVAVMAHEVGHAMLSHHTCQIFDNNPSTLDRPGFDHHSIMCGPRQRSMNAPDRIKLGWLTPRSESASMLSRSSFTLNADPMAGDALWIHGPGGSAATPSHGDVLVEARTFASAWDGPPDFNDDDFEDMAPIPHEGLLVYQFSPSPALAPVQSYSSMDNTGALRRREVDVGVLGRAWYLGVDPPHRSFARGDAYTPMSRFRFAFHEPAIPSPLALTDIAPGATTVSFTAWGQFLTDTRERSASFNQTLGAASSRARTDDWTFGGVLELGGTIEAVPSGTPTITLQPASVLRFSGDATLRGPTSYEWPVRAGASARVEVTGRMLAERVAFSALSASTGWGGIHVSARPREDPAVRATEPPVTFTGVSISGMRYDNAFGTMIPSRAALEVVNRRVLVNGGSLISGSVGANGVLASGPYAHVTLTGQSNVFSNSGMGILAVGGAQVFLNGEARVRENMLGGIYLSGYSTRATLTDQAQVNFNGGPGLRAISQATARLRADGTGVNTSVSFNSGGPTALSGGSVDAGQCTPTGHNLRPNRFDDNHLGGFYDARAEGGSTIAARYAYWNGRSSLIVQKDPSSTATVFPVAPTASAPDPACPAISADRSGDALALRAASIAGEAAAAAVRGRDVSADIVALAAEARAMAWDGDAEGAFALLDGAAQTAQTNDDRAAVYEAIGAVVATADSSALVAAMEATLVARAASAGAERPWARRALAVVYAVTGRPEPAEALAAALVTGEGATEHAVFGHALGVRLAVEADSAARAVDRLAAFAPLAVPTDTLATEAFGSSLALVAAAFPDADLSSLASARTGPATMAHATGGGDALRNGLDAFPNPLASQATVRVTTASASEAQVVLYDALGRRVAMLIDGALPAGVHDVPLDARRLAPGVYVVQVRVAREGAAWTDVRRLTVAR